MGLKGSKWRRNRSFEIPPNLLPTGDGSRSSLQSEENAHAHPVNGITSTAFKQNWSTITGGILNRGQPGVMNTFQNGVNQTVTKINYVNYDRESGKKIDIEKGDIVVALYSFEPRSQTELEFQQNDRMIVIDIHDADWFFATHEVTGKKGYVPLNYVTHVESLELFDWYFPTITRREAESLLLTKDDGTFLVRQSTSKPGEFALSIKHSSPERKTQIRHYSIKYYNYQYSIWDRVHFSNLKDLIEEYKVNTHGLPMLLGNPCPKVLPTMYELSIETKEEWEIDRGEIKLIKQLGEGNFGEVYYGKWKDRVEVAVKTLKKGSMPDEQFLEEATIMKALKHENILSLFATCSKEEPIYIITQYMKKGSLQTLLRQHKQEESLSIDQMLEFAFQISKGMHYLECQNLIHRDLAARNVLVDDALTCKIADFGLAKMLAKTDVLAVSSGKFPVKWSPPEVLLEGKFSIKSDVWSFGIVMIEIFSYGDTIYADMTQKQVRQEVVQGYRLPQPPLCPTYIYEVLLKCWDVNPEGRPAFRDLKAYFDESCHQVFDGTQYT